MTGPTPELWLRRARSNLALAQVGHGAGVMLEDLCFEAQQAAEKALKALLIHLGGDYPRTHAFTVLLTRLEAHVRVPDAVRDVVDLSDYAVQMRYPGDYYPISEEEYRRAVNLATRTVTWVEGQLQSEDRE